jgi:hypothetical protein
MPSYHHLYPFSPWGLHGGTLRLRTAIEASLLDGAASFSWWDATRSQWRSDVEPDDIGAPSPEPTAAVIETGAGDLKRRVFPFVMWEAGRKPRSGVADVLTQQPDATLVLHTSFLAPLAAGLRRSGRRVVVDVHDAIFRGHMDEAAGASVAMRALRAAYAKSVLQRERRALAGACGLAVAGWDDALILEGLGLRQLKWAPTGLEAQLSTMPESDKLRVGLLGNFHHSATARAASELVASPLGRDPEIEVIFAGIGSERYEGTAGVRTLGRIAAIDEFYNEVHATVVPVTIGTGMKCKLGEAALAGKAVITTPLGAKGYPPELREAFVVVDSAGSLDRRVVNDAIQRTSPDGIRARFDAVVGRGAAARTYAEVLQHSDHPVGQLQ